MKIRLEYFTTKKEYSLPERQFSKVEICIEGEWIRNARNIIYLEDENRVGCPLQWNRTKIETGEICWVEFEGKINYRPCGYGLVDVEIKDAKCR